MDMLGGVSEETGNQENSYRKNTERINRREAPALLLGWVCTSFKCEPVAEENRPPVKEASLQPAPDPRQYRCTYAGQLPSQGVWEYRETQQVRLMTALGSP